MADEPPASWRRMEEVGAEFRTTRAKLDDLRKQVHTLIPEALLDGMQPSKVVAATGYDRERVRRIARDAGVEDQTGRGKSTAAPAADTDQKV